MTTSIEPSGSTPHNGSQPSRPAASIARASRLTAHIDVERRAGVSGVLALGSTGDVARPAVSRLDAADAYPGIAGGHARPLPPRRRRGGAAGGAVQLPRSSGSGSSWSDRGVRPAGADDRIEQGGAEFEYHRELITLGRKMRFVVTSGSDTRLPEAYALGAAGCIGGLVNIGPEQMVEIDRVNRTR